MKTSISGTSPERIRPILKWAGGKYRLLDAIIPELPAGPRLVEPFVGSGAVFLNSDYPSYLLCDVNPDLIGFYTSLKRGGGRFIERCRGLFADGNAAEAYYARRERFNSLAAGAQRAALFLYLNRHGYNGLIRYNAGGGFNVPFGKYARPYFPEAEMRRFLRKAGACEVAFKCADYRTTFAELRGDDVVYCDPPYAPLSRTANFTTYSGTVFGEGDQRELAALVEAAAAKGIRLAVSNHALPVTRRLYGCADSIKEFAVRRSISRNGNGREMVSELLAVY